MSKEPGAAQTISPGFEGSRGGPSDGMALIGLLVTDAGRRLRLFSAIGMGIFASGIPLAIFLPPALGKPESVQEVMLILCGALLLLSLGVHLYARRSDVAPVSVVRVGLLYVVMASGAMAAAETILVADKVPEWDGVSGICIWIVLFPLIIPCLPRQALAASLASASMLPLLYLVQLKLGGAPLPPAVLVKWWVPVYFCAGLSFFAELSIQRLARGLAEQQASVRTAGRYELVEKLAEGGMGQVWRARHHFLPHDVAVKFIRPAAQQSVRPAESQELARRFQREAQAVAVLRSVNTVRLFDYGVSESGELFAVMEFLPGYDLKRFVLEYGPLPAGRVVHFLEQICLSLAEAHGMGLVHRDIKPANLMVSRLGCQSDLVKVLDFGLVGATGHAPEVLAGTTDESTVSGSPGFVAPEVLLGGRAGVSSDLYALGVVAYWMLTGTTLFPREGGGEDIARQLSEDPEPPAVRLQQAVPEDLARFVLQCVARDPADRPESALALRRDLRACACAGSWREGDADQWWATHAPN